MVQRVQYSGGRVTCAFQGVRPAICLLFTPDKLQTNCKGELWFSSWGLGEDVWRVEACSGASTLDRGNMDRLRTDPGSQAPPRSACFWNMRQRQGNSKMTDSV